MQIKVHHLWALYSHHVVWYSLEWFELPGFNDVPHHLAVLSEPSLPVDLKNPSPSSATVSPLQPNAILQHFMAQWRYDFDLTPTTTKTVFAFSPFFEQEETHHVTLEDLATAAQTSILEI